MTQEATKRQRTCIGCGAHDGKSSLHRIVRGLDGSVAFDPTGRAAGRGAYVCSRKCFDLARKARKLDRSLRTKVSEQDYERIAGELACVIDAMEDR